MNTLSTPKYIRAAIVSTGTEILQGLYADTNAQFLAGELTRLGYEVVVIAAAPDDEDAIERTFSSLFGRVDFILTTGGLGPTEDDNMRDVVARLWKAPLEFDQRAWEMIGERLKRRYPLVPESNRRQAMQPRGARPIYNNYGTAPGFFLRVNDERPAILTLPGPPREMKPLWAEQAIALLLKEFPPSLMQTVVQIHTAGRGEGELNDRIKDMFGARPDVTVALLASGGLVKVRLTLRAESKAALDHLRKEMIGEVTARLGASDIWGYDDDTLEAVVGRLLLARNWAVAVAESCTGGLVNAALTAVPGASAYVKAGYVVYSNEAKMRLLGVREETLAAHGAVSAETVAEMAEGARRDSGADIAAAVTGIAGPSGGSDEKPVGLVWFGISTQDGTETHRVQFPGERDLVRNFSMTRCLDLIRRRIQA